MNHFSLNNNYYPSVLDTITKAAPLINQKTGLINQIQENPLLPGQPRLFYLSARAADCTALNGLQNSIYNGGCSINRSRALASAIGETLERYSAVLYDKHLIRSTYSQLKDKAVNPRDFALGSSNEYSFADCPVAEYQDHTSLEWVEGISLLTQKKVLVPACLVYMQHPVPDFKQYIYQQISTGLACAVTLERAILSGILEVVERDAIAITWLNQLKAPDIDLEQIENRDVRYLKQELHRAGLELFCKNISTDFNIPVIFSLAIDRDREEPVLGIGAAASLDPVAALIRSLEELCHSRYSINNFFKSLPGELDRDFRKINNFSDRFLLYSRKKMLPALAFLLNRTHKQTINALPQFKQANDRERIKVCLNQISQTGLDVIVVDVTSEDIKNCGFHVVRVLIPGAQPITPDYRMRYLAGPRIYSVPLKMGIWQEPLAENKLNPYPHPFP